MPAEKPVLKRVSWRVVKQIGALDYERQAAKTGAEFLAVWEKIQTVLAEVIVSVPRSWLMDDAPASLNFADPSAFDYLTREAMVELISLVSGGEEKKEPNS
mgnify:FL=1|jgi:hypothetical protein